MSGELWFSLVAAFMKLTFLKPHFSGTWVECELFQVWLGLFITII